MKAFLMVVLILGLAAAALLVPVGGRSFWARAQERGIPAAMARGTAHGLRAGWDFIASLGQDHQQPTREVPAHSPKHQSRKAQAAAQHRTSREGIVAQPPKEKLHPADRDALDKLIANSR